MEGLRSTHTQANNDVYDVKTKLNCFLQARLMCLGAYCRWWDLRRLVSQPLALASFAASSSRNASLSCASRSLRACDRCCSSLICNLSESACISAATSWSSSEALTTSACTSSARVRSLVIVLERTLLTHCLRLRLQKAPLVGVAWVWAWEDSSIYLPSPRIAR